MADDIPQPASSSDSEPPDRSKRPRNPADLWLVGVNAGAALAIAACIAALNQAAVRGVMWTLAVTGICILLLCLAGYRSQ